MGPYKLNFLSSDVGHHLPSIANQGSSLQPWCLGFLLGVSYIDVELALIIQFLTGQTNIVWPKESTINYTVNLTIIDFTKSNPGSDV